MQISQSWHHLLCSLICCATLSTACSSSSTTTTTTQAPYAEKKSTIILELKVENIQVMVRLHIFPIFSFLAKMLSFLCKQDNNFSRNENIGKTCKRTITWTGFTNHQYIWAIFLDCSVCNSFFHKLYCGPGQYYSGSSCRWNPPNIVCVFMRSTGVSILVMVESRISLAPLVSWLSPLALNNP